MKHKLHLSIKFISVFVFILTLTSCDNNWPQFRGSNYNMVFEGKNLPVKWSEDTNVIWKTDLEGTGWSSPIVWGNKIFITSSILEKEAPRPPKEENPPSAPIGNERNRNQPPPPPQDDSLYFQDIYRMDVICYDLETGNEIWKKTVYTGNPKIKTHAGNTYASETPITDGEKIYAYFGMTGLYCLDMEGNLIWENDLGAYNTMNDWGTGSSPVLYNNKLIVQMDNEEKSFVIAIDATTGEEIWNSPRDEKTNYGTPIVWKNSVRTELVVGGATARGYNIENGEVIWELSITGGRNIASPVVNGDLLYIGNSGNRRNKGNLFAIKAGASDNITPANDSTGNEWIKWFHTQAGTGNPSILFYKDIIYTLGSNGEISTYDAISGELIYEDQMKKVAACWSSPWAANDIIHIIDEKGVTHMFNTGKQFEELGKNTIDDKVWATPAIVKNAYIIRGVKKLYCIGK